MRTARLAHETDFDGWLAAASALRAEGAAPDAVLWTTAEGGDLFAEAGAVAWPAPSGATPTAFLETARAAILHRSPERFARLYRLFARLHREPELMDAELDRDVTAVRALARAVERDAYRMEAYVRFREVAGEDAWVAWIEPQHRVVERAAGFFVRRFANMRWSILTPDRCAHWDGESLAFTPGAPKSAAPSHDAVEAYWRTYYASTFNPARLRVKAMTSQMPQRLWRNLPEAAEIDALVRGAGRAAEDMVAKGATVPARAGARALPRPRAAPEPTDAPPPDLASLAGVLPDCRRCGLWRPATQVVPGRGPAVARLMVVGEQPGDQEDLAGEPFIGPAGRVFDRALAEAGADRTQAYVTNAVKHFKYEPRGKRRIHARPDAGEVQACRWWLDHERRFVRPRVVVAMGATAGRAVFHRAVAVNRDRGRPTALDDGATGILTVHPAYILRLPDPAEQRRAYGMLVEDLAQAWRLAA